MRTAIEHRLKVQHKNSIEAATTIVSQILEEARRRGGMGSAQRINEDNNRGSVAVANGDIKASNDVTIKL